MMGKNFEIAFLIIILNLLFFRYSRAASPGGLVGKELITWGCNNNYMCGINTTNKTFDYKNKACSQTRRELIHNSTAHADFDQIMQEDRDHYGYYRSVTTTFFNTFIVPSRAHDELYTYGVDYFRNEFGYLSDQDAVLNRKIFTCPNSGEIKNVEGGRTEIMFDCNSMTYGYGLNGFGVLGTGEMSMIFPPSVISSETFFLKRMNYLASFLVKNDRKTILVSGSNKFGAYANSSLSLSYTKPEFVKIDEVFFSGEDEDVFVEDLFNCEVAYFVKLSNGKIYGWGRNSYLIDASKESIEITKEPREIKFSQPLGMSEDYEVLDIKCTPYYSEVTYVRCFLIAKDKNNNNFRRMFSWGLDISMLELPIGTMLAGTLMGRYFYSDDEYKEKWWFPCEIDRGDLGDDVETIDFIVNGNLVSILGSDGSIYGIGFNFESGMTDEKSYDTILRRPGLILTNYSGMVSSVPKIVDESFYILVAENHTCGGKLPGDPLVCNRRGMCSEIADVCECENGFSGDDCEIFPTCYGINGNESLVCNGHGWCMGDDFCYCYRNHGGDECEYFYCKGVLQSNESVCNEVGICIGVNQCSCDEFRGSNCDEDVSSSGVFLVDSGEILISYVVPLQYLEDYKLKSTFNCKRIITNADDHKLNQSCCSFEQNLNLGKTTHLRITIPTEYRHASTEKKQFVMKPISSDESFMVSVTYYSRIGTIIAVVLGTVIPSILITVTLVCIAIIVYFRVIKQKTLLRKFEKLDNFDILIAAQDDDVKKETFSHVRVNQEFLEINDVKKEETIEECKEYILYKAYWKGKKIFYKKYNIVDDSAKNDIKYFSSITHPHVLRFIGVCSEENALALEYCPKSLLDYILSNKLTFEEKINILYQIASTIEHIHSLDLKICTISHKSVFFDISGVKLVDFSHCSPFKKIIPKDSLKIDCYSAPEVSDERNLGKESDIYSLGVLFAKIMQEDFSNTSIKKDNFLNQCEEKKKWIKGIILDCISEDMLERPKINEICKIFQENSEKKKISFMKPTSFRDYKGNIDEDIEKEQKREKELNKVIFQKRKVLQEKTTRIIQLKKQIDGYAKLIEEE